MNNTINDLHKTLISNYIKAKDGNKPHQMQNVFSKFAVLDMNVKTENIAFPSKTNGLDLITDVLVKNSMKVMKIYTPFVFLTLFK